MASLTILIAGSGPAGLCAALPLARAGHSVTILEAAHALSPIGAAIHVPPNATRVLRSWGVAERIERLMREGKGNGNGRDDKGFGGFVFRRFEDEAVLGEVGVGARSSGDGKDGRIGFINDEDAPYWTLKRSVYQQALLEACTEAGVEIRYGAKVVALDETARQENESQHEINPATSPYQPTQTATAEAATGVTITLSTGQTLHGALLIIADGIRSRLRPLLLSQTSASASAAILQPLQTYRALAPTAQFSALASSDPAFAALLTPPARANVWMGPGRHVILYPVRGGEVLSINATGPVTRATGGASGERSATSAEGGEARLPAAEAAEVWSRPASSSELQAAFADFAPAVQAALGAAQDCKAWRIAAVSALPSWVSTGGRAVLAGDAAHGMGQFLAQGAAMATEDGAALGECLKRLGRAGRRVEKGGLLGLMRVYEAARKERCEVVAAQTRRNAAFLHLGEGAERERRDRRLAGEVLQGEKEEGDTGPFFDGPFREWLYGHNVVEHTNALLDAAGW